MNEKIKTFIDILKKDISGHEDNYCIVVFARDFYTSKFVAFIYKSLDDFKEKVEKDVESMDVRYSIDFQTWIFD